MPHQIQEMNQDWSKGENQPEQGGGLKKANQN